MFSTNKNCKKKFYNNGNITKVDLFDIKIFIIFFNFILIILNSARGSATSRSDATSEEALKALYVYDDNGYLPIHRAAFNGHEATIKNILDDVQKRNELVLQLEARTEKTELTPLLLATAVGRLEIIACLLRYPVNLNAIDANGHGK